MDFEQFLRIPLLQNICEKLVSSQVLFFLTQSFQENENQQFSNYINVNQSEKHRKVQHDAVEKHLFAWSNNSGFYSTE